MAVTKHSIYFARSEDALRNGSYYRADQRTFAQYMNGDYMGEQPLTKWPSLPVRDYVNFDARTARVLIPKCCK